MQDLHYLHLLLACSKSQAKALLETADKSQVLSVVKVLFNLERNILLLSKYSKSLLRKHNKLLTHLLKRTNSDKTNYSLIKKNWVKIFQLLTSAKSILTKVIL
jgi:hypothetical protein